MEQYKQEFIEFMVSEFLAFEKVAPGLDFTRKFAIC